jgi:hypothetical protein
MITGALLAESAGAVDNKLNVTGGVLEHYTVDSSRIVRAILVLLTQTQTGGTRRAVQIKFRPPTGEDPLIIDGPLPEEAASGEIGFALIAIGISLPFDGRWVIEVSAGGNAVALPLNIHSSE